MGYTLTKRTVKATIAAAAYVHCASAAINAAIALSYFSVGPVSYSKSNAKADGLQYNQWNLQDVQAPGQTEWG